MAAQKLAVAVVEQPVVVEVAVAAALGRRAGPCGTSGHCSWERWPDNAHT